MSQTIVLSKYILSGVSFGLLFPILAIIVDCCILNNGTFSIASIAMVYSNNPIHYIILTAPIVLGCAAYLIGRSVVQMQAINLKLQLANSALQENNNLLDMLNYHISHDIKSVFNNQIGLANMAIKYGEQKKMDKVQEILNLIFKVTEDGIQMLYKFLRLSKDTLINSERATEINVESAIRNTLEKLAITKTYHLTFSTSEFNNLKINADAFDSILLNILSNAIKYSVDPCTIDIQLIKNKISKQIIIRDNGIGIDLSQHENKLFKPFVRINDDPEIEGSGIGLYIVKKLVQDNNGLIDVKSELGKGTSIVLTFEN